MASEITHVPRQGTRPGIATLACLADGPCARVDGVAQVNRFRVRFVHLRQRLCWRHTSSYGILESTERFYGALPWSLERPPQSWVTSGRAGTRAAARPRSGLQALLA